PMRSVRPSPARSPETCIGSGRNASQDHDRVGLAQSDCGHPLLITAGHPGGDLWTTILPALRPGRDRFSAWTLTGVYLITAAIRYASTTPAGRDGRNGHVQGHHPDVGSGYPRPAEHDARGRNEVA